MKYLRWLSLCACLLAVNTAGAQEIGEVVDSVKSSMKGGSLKERVSKVQDAFKAKKASADSLVGTWQYQAPAVYATKGNVLVKLVGNTTASTLEKVLGQYIEKGNITPENTSMIFHENGTFEREIAGHKAQGIWMVNGEKLLLGIQNVQTASITTHLDQKGLMLLVDADKILDIMMVFGGLKESKGNKALAKLAKQLPGLQGGFLLVKKP